MPLEWEQVIVDSADPVALGRWWATALEWVVVNDDPEEFEIRAAPDRLPGILFGRVAEPKTLKNRLHLDVRPLPSYLALSAALATAVAVLGSLLPAYLASRFDPSANLQEV